MYSITNVTKATQSTIARTQIAKTIVFAGAALTITACTSYDDTPTAEEAANIAAAAAYQSETGDLSFAEDGTLSYKGEVLTTTNTQNGQNVYADITVDGQDYTLINANTGTGTALYALSSDNQFSDIGNSIPKYTSPEELTSTSFAGKYTERTINSTGEIGSEYSGAILLELDQASGTLSTITGPDITYTWDSTSQSFQGTGETSGQTNAYTDNTLLGVYATEGAETGSTDYGTFYGIGE